MEVGVAGWTESVVGDRDTASMYEYAPISILLLGCPDSMLEKEEEGYEVPRPLPPAGVRVVEEGLVSGRVVWFSAEAATTRTEPLKHSHTFS